MNPRLGLLALGVSLFILTACDLPYPIARLEVTPTSLQLTSASVTRTLTISNGGTRVSTLSWSTSSSSILITTDPSSGRLLGGRSSQLGIHVDQASLPLGDTLDETITITSNAGSATIAIHFEKTSSGLQACGTFPTAASAKNRATSKGLKYPPQGAFVPGQLLVRYRTVMSPSADATLKAYRETSRQVRGDYHLNTLKEGGSNAPDLVSTTEVLQTAALLESDPRVAYAHPNYCLKALSTPNDNSYSEQWNLANFGLPQAWDIETGSGKVVIAVIDSGVDMNHQDLASKVLPGCDFYDGDNDPNPGPANGGEAEHGTHVAGIAAAIGNNNVGIAGVAFASGVRILPVKIFDDTGTQATIAELVDGMLWAAGIPVQGIVNPNPAQIINMSVGAGPIDIPAVNDAANQAFKHGVVLFASAGNNGSGSSSPGVQSPANAPDIIAVGSVDNDYQRSFFSDFGSNGATVDIMAPGGFGPTSCGRVLSTFPNDSYGCLAGTSMASPFAAGVAALLLSRTPTMTAGEVRSTLSTTALFDSSSMNGAEYGSGVICADRALGAATQCGR